MKYTALWERSECTPLEFFGALSLIVAGLHLPIFFKVSLWGLETLYVRSYTMLWMSASLVVLLIFFKRVESHLHGLGSASMQQRHIMQSAELRLSADRVARWSRRVLSALIG